MGKTRMFGVVAVLGVLAAAAGTWFTFASPESKPAPVRPAEETVPRRVRSRTATPDRRGERPPPPPLRPDDPRARYRDSPADHAPGLADPDPKVRSFSAWKLKVLDPTAGALRPLVRCLKDPDLEVRDAAVSALGEYRDLPPDVVADLVAMIGNDDPTGFRACWAAAGRGNADFLGEAIKLHRKRGLSATREKSPPTSTLEAIAMESPEGYAFLKELLADPKPEVRRAALIEIPTCCELWKEARADPERLPLLRAALDDPEPRVREVAAWALERLRER